MIFQIWVVIPAVFDVKIIRSSPDFLHPPATAGFPTHTKIRHDLARFISNRDNMFQAPNQVVLQIPFKKSTPQVELFPAISCYFMLFPILGWLKKTAMLLQATETWMPTSPSMRGAPLHQRPVKGTSRIQIFGDTNNIAGILKKIGSTAVLRYDPTCIIY